MIGFNDMEEVERTCMKDEEKNCLSLIRKSCLWPDFELASLILLNNEFLSGKEEIKEHFIYEKV